MNNTNTDIDIAFRFLRLDKMQAYTLKHEVMGASFLETDDPKSFIGVVELSQHAIHDINDFFVRQQVSVAHCDILVSAATPAATIKVPRVVNEMLKYIDCQLTYSIKIV
ncbi:hypothetical protein ACFSJY_05395 [Thalassotalea euphylliae]|uniref:hypothetical protein n=1 Tax=Thalassotalea euphylliae TaxID=1655234 RepID=UPI00362C520A